MSYPSSGNIGLCMRTCMFVNRERTIFCLALSVLSSCMHRLYLCMHKVCVCVYAIPSSTSSVLSTYYVSLCAFVSVTVCDAGSSVWVYLCTCVYMHLFHLLHLMSLLEQCNYIST